MKPFVLTDVKALPVTKDDPEVFPEEYLQKLLQLPEEKQQMWVHLYLQGFKNIPSFVEENIKHL